MAKSKNDSTALQQQQQQQQQQQRAMTEATATKAAAAAAAAAAAGKKKKKSSSIYSTLSPTQVFFAALAVIALLLGWAVLSSKQQQQQQQQQQPNAPVAVHTDNKADEEKKTNGGRDDTTPGRSSSSHRDEKNNESSSFVVGAYLPDYRFYIGHLETSSLLLTDLMLFSVDPSAYVEATTATTTLSPAHNNIFHNTCCLSQDHFQRAQKAVEASSSGKLDMWVTIGGAGRLAGTTTWFVAGMKSMQAATEGPAGPWYIFVQHLLTYAHRNQITGIDLDSSGLLTILKSHEDYVSYLTFLQFITATLEEHGIKTSFALHKGMYLPTQLYEKADRIHLMTYGMNPGEDASLHHASMELVKDAVNGLIKSGCPRNKIVLGIPAYGMHPHSGEVKTFAEIYDETVGGEEDDDGDDKSNKSVMDTQHSWKGYRYDSPADIKSKVQYAAKERLRGVFLWEMGQDKPDLGQNSPGILVRAMAKAAAGANVATSVKSTMQGHAEKNMASTPPEDEL